MMSRVGGGASKSLQNQQSTLFQTWGYQGNIIPDKRVQSTLGLTKQKGKALKEKSRLTSTRPNNDSNELWTATSDKKADENGNDLDNFDDLMLDELDDVDDAAMSEAVNQIEKLTYVDQNFNPTSSPEDLPGFDSTSGDNYIYPINYPVRDYQFTIITKALIKNTLVVLPTGLGKTFIAAVVMYNYYRWYPQGKILFMAPTKPLVAQQIQACYSITGIPLKDTAEMTGSMPPPKRKMLWESKRVFFLTPHILQNDIGRGACFAKDVVCLVFDEAHKALGNYAYCQVIKEVSGCKNDFRVLALSATPGDDMKAVQSVVENLLISHIELRSEESPDIKPYVFDRNVEKIVVPLSDELKRTKSQFNQVLQGVIHRLHANGVCWQSDPSRVSKFFLLKARDQFRERGMDDRARVGMIEGDFALAISLYHAFELLQQHGILSFYNFLKEICSGNKGTTRARHELMRHEKFMEMMQDLQQKIEPGDNLDESLNGSTLGPLTPKRRLLKSIPKPTSLVSSHPKLNKLEEIVVRHFEKAKENLTGLASQTPLNTRVMIFSQYRDSVQEITAILNKHKPLVKVMSFVGQNGTAKGKKGLTQKEQLEVVEKFRKGGYNVLVSTSVGEEGLDIGDVDLIICFDASNSPIRLVQRMGRTGRKRAGKIVILVTEGKEEQIYKRSLTNKKSIHKKLINASNSLVLYDQSPRMIPKHLNPYCLKMQITINTEDAKSRGTKRKSTDRKLEKNSEKGVRRQVRTIEKSMQSGHCLLNPEEEQYWRNNFQFIDYSHRKEGAKLEDLESDYPVVNVNEWLQWQSIPQPVKYATHSTRTYKFCELIEHFDALGAEMDEEGYHYKELRKYYEDNIFLKMKSNKKSKKSEGTRRKERASSEKGNDELKSGRAKKDRKSEKQIKIDSAKCWRQRNLRTNDFYDSEEDDDFVTIKKPANEAKISLPCFDVCEDGECQAGCDSNDETCIPVKDVAVENRKPAICNNEFQMTVCNAECNSKDLSLETRIASICNDEGQSTACNADCYSKRALEHNEVYEDMNLQKNMNNELGEECKMDICEVFHDRMGQENNVNIIDATEEKLDCTDKIQASKLDRRANFTPKTGITSYKKSNEKQLNELDIEDISSQRASSFFPSSTPSRSFLKIKSKSSEFKFRKRNLSNLVPSPPKLSDLSCLSFGNISEFDTDCLEVDELNADENMDENEMKKKDLDDSILQSKAYNCMPKKMLENQINLTSQSRKCLKFKDNDNCENVPIDSDISLMNTSDNNLGSKIDLSKQPAKDVQPVRQFTLKNVYNESFNENNQIVKPEDISNIDFGDSFADVCEFEDFDDCPSPPVVASVPVTNNMKIQNAPGGVTDKSYEYEENKGLVNSTSPVVRLCCTDANYIGNTETKTELDSPLKRYSGVGISAIRSPENFSFSGNKHNALLITSPNVKLDINIGNGKSGKLTASSDVKISMKQELALNDSVITGFEQDYEQLPGDCDILNESRRDDEDPETQRPVLSLFSRLRNQNLPCLNKLKREDLNLLASPEGKSLNGCVKKEIDENEIVMSSDDKMDDTESESPVLKRRKQGIRLQSDESDAENDYKSSSLSRQKREAGSTVDKQPYSTSNSADDDSPVYRAKNRKVNNRILDQNSDEDSPLNFRRKRKTKCRVLDETFAEKSDVGRKPMNKKKNDDDSDDILANRMDSKHRQRVEKRFEEDNRDSEDDFDLDTSLKRPKKNFQKEKFPRNGKLKNQNKMRREPRVMSNFIEMEAEVTDEGSEDEDFSMNEDGYVMDSFIDDGTQLTQPTPAKNCKERNNVDMNMIYRQSLFSPIYGALNFRTPAYRSDRNRYKMVGRQAWHEPSDGEDEAEEVNGLITDEGDFVDEGESLLGDFSDYQSPEKQPNHKESPQSCTKDHFLVPKSVCRPKKSRVRRIVDSDEEEEPNRTLITHTTEINRGLNQATVKEKPKLVQNITEIKANISICQSVKNGKSSEQSEREIQTGKSPVHPTSYVASNSIECSSAESPVDNDNYFIPSFDLGLDLGELDKDMIETAWKNISSSEDNTRYTTPSKASLSTNGTILKTPTQEKLTIFAQSKAISACQVGTFLRLRHHLSLTVCPQLACDFTVSKRMGILRRCYSDISNGANSKKNMTAIREMCDNYRERCIVIEKDRVKGTAINEKPVSYTKYYCGLLGYFAELKIKLLFSDSQEETALLISKLANIEKEKKCEYSESFTKLNGHDMEQMLGFLLTIPYLTYPVALEICHKYRSLSAIIKSNSDELKAKIPQITTSKAKEIIQFFQHKVTLP